MSIELFILLGVIFGFLAGLIAFLITFNEWKKHTFEGWQLWREPLARGLVTFLFFFLLSIALGFILPFVVQ
ncbi:MAG TPA: hypothetical protein VMU27_00185 [Candidatus Paceibacterota bacterium]|nr:hypothetical protein [Candidatus Paceibacterota bacterium]